MRDKVLRVESLRVEVLDSAECGFVPRERVESILRDDFSVIGSMVDSVKFDEIEKALRLIPATSYVDVGVTMDGVLCVEMQQHKPYLRIKGEGENGVMDFYLDTLCNMIPPTKGYRPEVPVITGKMPLEISVDSLGIKYWEKTECALIFLEKIFNFAKLIGSDSFFTNFVGQIYICKGGRDGEFSLKIVPNRMAGVVEFGGFEDMEIKLKKVKTFYRDAYKYSSLGLGDIVDVRFDGQILLRRAES